MELRPGIKDLPKAQAITLIENTCIRYRLPYNHIAPMLGFELRDENNVPEKKTVKPTPKSIIPTAPKKEPCSNAIEKKIERKKITFSQKTKIKKPTIKDLFADNGERIRFYGMLHYLKSCGVGLHSEFTSLAKEKRYEWIKNNKDKVLNYSANKHKSPVILRLSKDEALDTPKPEQLKPISGYPNYHISNLGNVWSDASGKRKLVAKGKHRDGRLYAMLWRNNKRKPFYVHRLMAEYWMVKVDGLTDVFFRNGDKSDCRLENLYFAKQPPNKPTWNASTKAKGETLTWWVKLKEQEVIEIYLSNKKHYVLAKQYGVARELITMIKNGKRWKWLTSKLNHNIAV